MADERDQRGDPGSGDGVIIPEWIRKQESALKVGDVNVPITIGRNQDEEIWPSSTLRFVMVHQISIAADPFGDETTVQFPEGLVVLVTQAGIEDEGEGSGKDGTWTADLSRELGTAVGIPKVVDAFHEGGFPPVDVVATCSGLPPKLYPFSGEEDRILFSRASHSGIPGEGFASVIFPLLDETKAGMTFHSPNPFHGGTNFDQFMSLRNQGQ